MLVLSRKKNESIIINDDITIIVVDICGDKVRLGVEAPKEVPMHRKAVHDPIGHKVPRDDRIRQRIDDLKRQIQELEAELFSSGEQGGV